MQGATPPRRPSRFGTHTLAEGARVAKGAACGCANTCGHTKDLWRSRQGQKAHKDKSKRWLQLCSRGACFARTADRTRHACCKRGSDQTHTHRHTTMLVCSMKQWPAPLLNEALADWRMRLRASSALSLRCRCMDDRGWQASYGSMTRPRHDPTTTSLEGLAHQGASWREMRPERSRCVRKSCQPMAPGAPTSSVRTNCGGQAAEGGRRGGGLPAM